MQIILFNNIIKRIDFWNYFVYDIIDLNAMWYRYVPDNIKAANFEEWRKVRELSISIAKNCDLTWYKRNLQVPLLYDTLEETINVMGHLFGRDAALEVLKSKQTMWWMSMGITWDDKRNI